MSLGGVSVAVIDRQLPFCGIRSWVDEVERALDGRLCSLEDADGAPLGAWVSGPCSVRPCVSILRGLRFAYDALDMKT